MGGRTAYMMDTGDRENDANIGKDLTLKFLIQNGFIEEKVGKELQQTLFLTARKKNWFSRFFKQGEDEAVWRMAKLTEVPEKIQNNEESE